MQSYALGDVLRLVAPGCDVISMGKPTAGALCSVLLAHGASREHEDELLVANADQWSMSAWTAFWQPPEPAVGRRHHDVPQHPSALVGTSRTEHDQVVAVAEKQPISRNATAGLYYFRRGTDFAEGAERMLLKNARAAASSTSRRSTTSSSCKADAIGTFAITADQMHGLGTPEEVERLQARAARAPRNRMLNIVLPMAGRGSRFAAAGYDLPKPLIPVHGVPMIELVVHNVRPPRAASLHLPRAR